MTEGMPAGTITLLFSDIEGSTELVRTLGEGYVRLMEDHQELLRAVCTERSGVELNTQGDSFFFAFQSARDAVAASIAAQFAIASHRWPESAIVRVRIGLHTGEPHHDQKGYTGVAVHRAARICSIGHGGQVLLSRATAGIIDDDELPGAQLRDLGEHRLKDFERPERVFQLVVEGLPAEFPPLRSLRRQVQLTGTVTIVVVEGRRFMRMSRELDPETFGALLREYRDLLQPLLEGLGGLQIEIHGDAAMAVFPTPKQAVLAAAEAVRAIDSKAWIAGLRPEASVGLHSGPAGVGWVGQAAVRGSELCDAAEGRQVLLSAATAALLEDEDLGDLSIRDAGEVVTRRSGKAIRAYELVLR